MIAVSELDLPSAQQADALAEKLLDDQIQESEVLELTRLLGSSEEARRAYLARMLVHAELSGLIATTEENAML